MKKPNIRKRLRSSNTSQHYIANDEIYTAWLEWKNSAENVEDRVVPTSLANCIIKIADHMLQAQSFVHYDIWLKEDMRSAGILKMLKNLKNLKEEKRASFFNYCTLCIYCGFVGELKKHYRHQNILEELRKKTKEAYGDTSLCLK